jgi:hypothetical protein
MSTLAERVKDIVNETLIENQGDISLTAKQLCVSYCKIVRNMDKALQETLWKSRPKICKSCNIVLDHKNSYIKKFKKRLVSGLIKEYKKLQCRECQHRYMKKYTSKEIDYV